MCAQMSFQVMRREKGLFAVTFIALKWSFLCVYPDVFGEVAPSSEAFAALLEVTTEKIPFMKSLMRTQSVQSVESLFTSCRVATIWLLTYGMAKIRERHKYL